MTRTMTVDLGNELCHSPIFKLLVLTRQFNVFLIGLNLYYNHCPKNSLGIVPLAQFTYESPHF
jgi:hypothetical protein